jgi:hypothetical protein
VPRVAGGFGATTATLGWPWARGGGRRRASTPGCYAPWLGWLGPVAAPPLFRGRPSSCTTLVGAGCQPPASGLGSRPPVAHLAVGFCPVRRPGWLQCRWALLHGSVRRFSAPRWEWSRGKSLGSACRPVTATLSDVVYLLECVTLFPYSLFFGEHSG